MNPSGTEVIFHDPFSQEGNQAAASRLVTEHPPRRVNNRRSRSERKEAARIKAIEAVSQDLVVLARLRTPGHLTDRVEGAGVASTGPIR